MKFSRVLSALAVLCAPAAPAGAQPVAISQLPNATLPLCNEYVPLVQAGTTKKAPACAFGIAFVGSLAPSPLAPYQYWWNTSTSPPTLEAYDGLQWDAIGTLDPNAHVWTPGGISIGLTLPSSLFASVVNVGADGTLTVSFATVAQNTFLAGPASGGSGLPTLRAITADDLPLPTLSTIGGVEAINAGTHQWINAITTGGVPTLSQPAFTDISGILGAAQLPLPTTSALGGVESIACAAHTWIDVVPATAVQPTCAQPAFADISGSLTLSQFPSISANTVLGNGGGGAGVPTALAMPPCSAASNALEWTTSTGFACNSAINASTLGGATFASPGAIGGTTPGSGVFSSLKDTGVVGCNTLYQAVQTDGGGNENCGSPNGLAHAPNGYTSGNYYGIPAASSMTASGATLVANQLYGVPFVVGASQTFTKMSIDVTTLSAGACELGVYTDSAGIPGAKIVDVGNVNTGSTGILEVTGATISLAPGHYWFAVGCNSTPVLEVPSSNTEWCELMGGAGFATCYGGYRAAWTYSAGALPATFSAGGSNAFVSNNFVMAALRF